MDRRVLVMFFTEYENHSHLDISVQVWENGACDYHPTLCTIDIAHPRPKPLNTSGEFARAMAMLAARALIVQDLTIREPVKLEDLPPVITET